MRLQTLLERMEYTCPQGSADIEVTDLVYDSRKVAQGSVFVCIKGAVVDGHTFLPSVCKAGAAAVVVQDEVEVPGGVTVIRVPDTRLALAELSAAYFGHPAEQLKTIGITGTKGKTTTTYMIKSILEHAGYRVGLIGTIETIIGETHIPAVNTTPESYVIQESFRKMVDAGMDVVVMEVSSQGLKLHRVGGFVFDIGIFTNLEPDHIGPNEHASFEEYMECKGMLFKQCRLGIVNADDEHTEKLLAGHTCEIETYGLSEKADLRAADMELIKGKGYLGVKYHAKGLWTARWRFMCPAVSACTIRSQRLPYVIILKSQPKISSQRCVPRRSRAASRS